LERAEARGAPVYLEITGYASQRDPDPEGIGLGLIDSMKIAMANAGCAPQDIDYISAYGPGDRSLDAIEVRVIKEVFGNRAYSIPISSIKGVTGNPLAAGGPLQVAACAMSFRNQLLSPTANYEVADPDCDLDFIPSRPRRTRLNCALVNVRGLGGSASTMVLRRLR